MRSLLVCLLLAVVALGGCLTDDETTPILAEAPRLLPEALVDVLAPGPYTFETADYELGEMTVGGPDAAHDVGDETSLIRGTITVPDGRGPFPLAVFLHGQHQTCSDGQGNEGNNCDIPYRNDQGYLYLMEYLASHGVATASILAHEINRWNGGGDVGMWARGELVLGTIDALANSNYGARLDTERIGLMGHSRGGEGVVTAVEVNLGREVPYNLSAVIALAPTDFAYRAVPEVPFLTLAPYCDGDVYNLHGLRQFDQSRFTDSSVVKIQLLVMGANHNNYNTMWGKPPVNDYQRRGDDAGIGRHQNTECDLNREHGGERLTLEETYAQSVLHLGGFLRWTLLDHDGLAPHFYGAQQPAATCPMAVSCPGATHISTMAPGRVDLLWADETGPVTPDGVTVDDLPSCQGDGCAGNVYQSAWLLDQQIVQDASFTMRFDEPRDVTAAPLLNVRVAVPTHASAPAMGPPEMWVRFDSSNGGAEQRVDHPALFMPPALPVDPGASAVGLLSLGGSKVSANAIVIEVPAEYQGNLTAITLRFESPALDQIYLADAWLNPNTAMTGA